MQGKMCKCAFTKLKVNSIYVVASIDTHNSSKYKAYLLHKHMQSAVKCKKSLLFWWEEKLKQQCIIFIKTINYYCTTIIFQSIICILMKIDVALKIAIITLFCYIYGKTWITLLNKQIIKAYLILHYAFSNQGWNAFTIFRVAYMYLHKYTHLHIYNWVDCKFINFSP